MASGSATVIESSMASGGATVIEATENATTRSRIAGSSDLSAAKRKRKPTKMEKAQRDVNATFENFYSNKKIVATGRNEIKYED